MKRPTDVPRAERALAEFLSALGYDLASEDLRDTPRRVVEAFASDLLAGETIDAARVVSDGSVSGGSASLVVVRDIDVSCLCPHHLLPAQGTAVVAYVPGERLMGLGTVAALVFALSRRLTLQERITEAVVEHLMLQGGAAGAYCRMRLEHACLRQRGQRQSQAVVVSSKRAGCLLESTWEKELSLALGGTP